MDRPRIALLTPWLAVAFACAGGGADAPTRPLVVASVPPLAWLARALAPPEAVDVTSLVPPGASPSSHEPGMRELRALSRASLWVRVGHPHFPFERTRLDPLARERPELGVVSVFTGAGHASNDPHVWTDPGGLAGTVDRLAAALAALAPDAADEIAARRGDVRAEIEALDAELRSMLAPFEGRSFVVFHPAFSHLADAYGLVQLAVEEGHREASGPDLVRLVERARASGARAVFVQPQFDRSGAGVVAEALGAELIVLDPLAADWPEAMRATGRALARSFAP